MYHHQDWEPVTIHSSESKKREARPHNRPGTKNFQRLCEDDIPQLNTITKEQSIALLEARNSQKLSQKDLAKKLNIDVSTVQQYENGKIKNFNKRLYTTMMRNLGVKV